MFRFRAQNAAVGKTFLKLRGATLRYGATLRVADELTATGAGSVLMNDLLKWVRGELSWEVNNKYVQWNKLVKFIPLLWD